MKAVKLFKNIGLFFGGLMFSIGASAQETVAPKPEQIARQETIEISTGKTTPAESVKAVEPTP